MTREEIILLVQEAVIGVPNENAFDFRLPQIETIYFQNAAAERFAALVAAAEREACAKLCDHEMVEQGYGSDGWHIAKALAKTIRAREV